MNNEKVLLVLINFNSSVTNLALFHPSVPFAIITSAISQTNNATSY